MASQLRHMHLPASDEKNELVAVREVEEEQQRGWHEFHRPLLETIIVKLPFPDYIRFAAVCSSWRQVQRSHYLPAPCPDVPWLVYHNATKGEAHTIFNHSGLSCEIDIRGTSRMNILGCAYGWLLYHSCFSEEHFLLNPITGSCIDVPAKPRWTMGRRLVSRAVFSSDPAITDPTNVIIMYLIKTDLVYCRLSDSEWSKIPLGVPNTLHGRMMFDMVACNGDIYVLTGEGMFGLVDVSSKPPTVNWLISENFYDQDLHTVTCFLVESLGEILLVVVNHDMSYKVYKPDLSRMMWAAVSDLHDRVLFLGRACSMSASASATGKSGIYFNYPGDHVKFAEEADQRWPWVKEFIWKWKMAVAASNWYWMLPRV